MAPLLLGLGFMAPVLSWAMAKGAVASAAANANGRRIERRDDEMFMG